MHAATKALMALLALISLAQLRQIIGDERSPPEVEPHAETQLLMTELLRPPPEADELEQYRKLDQLLKIARDDGPRFVQQVVLHEIENEKPGAEAGPYWFLGQANIPKGQYAAGLSTLLYCDDERIRRYAWKLFPLAIGCGCVNDHSDLSHFRDYVTGDFQVEQVATPLKRAIFESAPNAAFLLFHSEAEADELIPFRRMERQVSNGMYEKKWLGGIPAGKVDEKTAATLRELGESKYWWARMFVAEVMVQNKEFRDPDLIKKLSDDEDTLVRQSVAAIENPDPLRAAKVDR